MSCLLVNRLVVSIYLWELAVPTRSRPQAADPRAARTPVGIFPHYSCILVLSLVMNMRYAFIFIVTYERNKKYYT